MACDEHPNLIVMDIQLPGMDGLEATVLLKRDDATRAIPVMALTALAVSDAERAALLGHVAGWAPMSTEERVWSLPSWTTRQRYVKRAQTY